MHLSDDKSSRQFIIRYSQVESSPSKKKNRYSQRKQYTDVFQAQTQLNISTKRTKSHRKNYQLLQTQANPTPRIKLAQSPKIQRNNSSSVDAYNHHQERLEARQKVKKQQRQYSKIPIQYYDERDYGNIADKVRGRVIYRGYAPKNTYYYLKTIKDLHFVQDSIRNLRGEDIAFNSKFQSGNLNTVVKISQKQYWLFMRQDTNTHGLRQWYYFEVKVKKAMRVKFRLYKFSKPFSLYKDGMKPYIRTLLSQWKQQGQNVKYQLDNQIKCYYLQFQYEFQDNTQTYFATLPPYTYSNMIDYLKLLKEEDNIKVQNIGYSLSGLQIPSIVIKNNNLIKNEFQHYHKKEAIFIMARTHPGETNSNFALEGFISKLLLDPYLLQKYDYYIIPMVNPDGVFLGNHRTGVLGQDLNRNFNSDQMEYFPQIQIIHRWITQIKRSQKIAFMIDLHGHSAKKNIFAYGQQHEFGSNKYLYSRILPKILSDTIDTFKYDHCVFRASKQKKNTARVYFSKKYKINSITFQQSYGLIQAGAIGIQNWKNFGIALAESLKTFCQMTQKDGIKNMEQALKDQMKLQKIQIQKRNQKHMKIMSMHEKLGPQLKPQKRRTQVLQGLSSELQKSFQMYISQIKQKQERQQIIQVQKQQEEIESEDKTSINSQQLSSGDQDMQLTNNQFEIIKKDIIRVKAQKQITKREIYNLADKKVQLKAAWGHHEQPRLHNDRSSMIPRILKLQMKKKQQYLAHNYIGGASYHFRQKKGSIELPYLKK